MRAKAILLLGMLTPASALAGGYTVSSINVAFQDISAFGMELTFANSDDDSVAVMLPFEFNFFGTIYPAGTTVYVNTNGLIDLDGPNDEFSNQPFPGATPPNAIMAPFWDDLDVAGGTVHVLASPPPMGIFVVQWTNVLLLGSAETVSFQVGLLEGTDDVVFGYGARTGAGGSASVGLQSPGGTAGAMAVCQTTCTFADIPPDTQLVFERGPGPDVDLTLSVIDTPPATAMTGQPLNLQFTADVIGNGTAGANTISLLISDVLPAAQNGVVVESINMPATPAGSTFSDMFTGNVPPGYEGLTVYSAIVVDSGNDVAESDEQNNEFELGPTMILGNAAITITTPGQLPNGVVGQLYDLQLQQVGGANPAWSTTGGGLPAGITLSPQGRLTGTPSQPGNFEFEVEASEAGSASGFQIFELVVLDAGTLSIVNPAPPTGTVGTPYSYTFQASGGTAPYSFASDVTPPGLTMAPDGTLSGTPSSEGQTTMTVTVLDNVGASAMAQTTVTISGAINPGDLRITIPDNITVPRGGNANVRLTAEGGTAPYTWTATGLLAGLTVNGALIRGVTTASIAQSAALQVTDSVGAMATKTVLVTPVVNVPPPGGGGGRSRGGCGCHIVGLPAVDPAILLLIGFMLWARRNRPSPKK